MFYSLVLSAVFLCWVSVGAVGDKPTLVLKGHRVVVQAGSVLEKDMQLQAGYARALEILESHSDGPEVREAMEKLHLLVDWSGAKRGSKPKNMDGVVAAFKKEISALPLKEEEKAVIAGVVDRANKRRGLSTAAIAGIGAGGAAVILTALGVAAHVIKTRQAKGMSPSTTTSGQLPAPAGSGVGASEGSPLTHVVPADAPPVSGTTGVSLASDGSAAREDALPTGSGASDSNASRQVFARAVEPAFHANSPLKETVLDVRRCSSEVVGAGARSVSHPTDGPVGVGSGFSVDPVDAGTLPSSMDELRESMGWSTFSLGPSPLAGDITSPAWGKMWISAHKGVTAELYSINSYFTGNMVGCMRANGEISWISRELEECRHRAMKARSERTSQP